MPKFNYTESEYAYQNIENKLITIHTHNDAEIELTRKDLLEMLQTMDSGHSHCSYCDEPLNDITFFLGSECEHKHKTPDKFEKTALLIHENLTDRRGIKHAIYEEQKAHVNEWIRILYSESTSDILATEIVQASCLIGSFDNEWESCDDDIQQEIKDTIATIIKQNLN
jgi:hypothetical protein